MRTCDLPAASHLHDVVGLAVALATCAVVLSAQSARTPISASATILAAALALRSATRTAKAGRPKAGGTSRRAPAKRCCAAALVARFYYIYAVDYDRGGEWSGQAFMCTRDKEFTIRGIEDCLARGFDRTGFFEVDTGEQRSWTVQLTESRPSSASAAEPSDAAAAGRASGRCRRPDRRDETAPAAKIVATLGPASSDKAMIAKLFEAGADVFRINMSHTSHERMRELVAIDPRGRGRQRPPDRHPGRSAGPEAAASAASPAARVMLKQGRDLRPRLRCRRPAMPARVHLPHPEIFAARRAGPHAAARRRQGAARRAPRPSPTQHRRPASRSAASCPTARA